MATCVFYIDEAGSFNPHHVPIKNGETPIFPLASIAFPLQDWRERDREYLALKRNIFPGKLIKSNIREEHIEIKGKDLAAPRNAGSKRHHTFLYHALKLIADKQGCCFGVTFLKNHISPTSPVSLYTHALQILVERFTIFIAEHEVYDGGILVCDSRSSGLHGKENISVVKSHMSYIFGHETGRTCLNILEAPLFADSRFCVGLQLADTFASALFTNYYQHYIVNSPKGTTPGAKNYAHMVQYWETLKAIEFKSLNPKITKFGYRVVDYRGRK
jgi:hypothetical protein